MPNKIGFEVIPQREHGHGEVVNPIVHVKFYGSVESLNEAIHARVVNSHFNVPDTQKLTEFLEKQGLKLWFPICSENFGYGKICNLVGKDGFSNRGS